jgi:protein phosphatase
MSLGQSASISDAGRKRRRNEDAYVREPPLFAVADGMGGAQAGEIASRLAAAALRSAPLELGGERQVIELIQEANRRVYERSSEDDAVSGMGTTMTVALVEDGWVRIGHVGDSRGYLIRDGQLEQLTEDHSLVAELVRSGKLSPEEAEVHPQRSVITRALGTEPDVDVDAFSVETKAGDVFMLCSDGLTSMVDDGTILELVGKHRGDLKKAAKALVDAANKGGGEDNITIVFFEIAAAGLEDTVQLSPATETARNPDEEDTLSGLEGIPTVSDGLVATAEAPQEPEVTDSPVAPARKRRRRRRWPAILAVIGVVACVLVGLGVWELSRAHFVGAQPNGHVAVYQGIPWDLGGGVHLYRLVYESPLLSAQLSQAERGNLFNHDLRSKHQAVRLVKAFEQDAIP